MIVFAIALSLFSAASVVSADSSGTYYLDISGNTDWKPASGEKLCATFTKADGGGASSVKTLTSVEDGKVYKVTGVPSEAKNIQLYLVRKGFEMLGTTPAKGTHRVFYNNKKAGWDKPYIYSWTGDGTTDATRNHKWPGEPMTRIGSTDYWYYDAPFDNIIFNNGKDGQATVQTEDLKVEGDSPVFSSPTGSTWDSAPYYKKYTKAAIDTRSSGNEFYVKKNDSLELSKYPYNESEKDSKPRAYSNKQVIYLYNPDWTDASKVKVTWDFDDPYRSTLTMTRMTDSNKPSGVFDAAVPAGFYFATVPDDANIQFSYNLASSNKTDVPTGQTNMCYNLKNGANVWCKLKDALGEVTDYSVGVETATTNDSNKSYAFWTDAVYYDYLSDYELKGSSWLSPVRAGTKPESPGTNNYDGAIDDWYEFYNFNAAISKEAQNNSSWKYPLYFGNFCANWDAYLNFVSGVGYKSAGRDASTPALGKGYLGPNATGLTRFDYIANNSNGLKPNANQLDADFNYAVQGLAYSTTQSGKSSLSSDGTIQYADGKNMPYFDSEWLKNNKIGGKSVGKTIRSSFPFYKEVSSGVTTYTFDSQNATDNVFFNWDGDTPKSVGYGRGTQYGVSDGLRNFMGNTDATKGIFPFNNTAKTKSGRGGNENLDYGFGIKINMDFRVPAGGKLPNNQDVKFEYSGDDDLWVYISEYDNAGKLTNSRLALDLGGNHKKASGEINFNTMKSTAKKVVNLKESATYKRDRIYIKDVDGWGSVYVYAYNDTDGEWYKASKDSSGNYYVSASQTSDGGSSRLDSKTMFTLTKGKNDWSKRSPGKLSDGKSTNDNYGSGRDTLANHWGKLTYTNNINYIDQSSSDANYEYKTEKVTDFGFEPLRSSCYAQLDPTKTYHLTVFYMERGMIESNAKMKFTMTPAQNDLKVNKTVDTTDVNHGLEEALKSQKFEFTNSEEGTLNKTSRYTLNNETETKLVDSSTGVYKLADGDTADFNNQYTTGNKIVVAEKEKTAGVRYSAKWQVVDNANGNLVAPSSGEYKSGRSTDSFELKDSTVDTNNAKLQVNMVNTPSVQSLTLSKKVRNEDDSADIDTDKEFRFRIKVDVDGDGSYKPYELGYKVMSDGDTTSLNTNPTTGEFRFSAKDKVVIEGLPVGAKYQIEEVATPGYVPLRAKVNGGADNSFNGVMTGTIESSGNTVDFTNREKPISTQLKAKKYITDGDSEIIYNSAGTNNELFSFTAKGLGEISYDGVNNSIDVSNTEKTIQSVNSDGEIIFLNKGGSDKFLNFTDPGVYLYSIVENGIVKENDKTDDSSLTTYKDDIGVDTQKYIAKVEVSYDGTELVVGDDSISYYKWDGNTPSASTFTDANKVSEIIFKNPIQNHGTLTVNKFDSLDSLDGVEFTLYKVGAEDEAITDATEKVATKLTVDGKVTFDNLDIYEKTDGKYKGLMNYQWYAVEESSAKDGYFKEPTVHYFRLPVLNGTEVKYDIEYTYLNGALVTPDSGSFTSFVFPFGIALVILSMMGAAAYYLRVQRKPLKHARKGALKH